MKRVTTHQAQAEELLSAMNLLMNDVASYKSAVALLAVHSAIAFNDAVLEKLGVATSKKSPDHSAAYKKTDKACVEKKIDRNGLQHLRNLLANKTGYSYSGIVDEKKAQDAALKAQRFANWAYGTVLKRESRNV
jgi:hypothetical protein